MDTTTQEIKKPPLVTVLMLTYNRAKYIATAIDSILAQTYQNFELVIIDDGSTDSTNKILSTYEDSRITIISYPHNEGLHARRKESLAYVEGKYVAVLDSDDVWTDMNKLSEQVDYMEKNEDCAVVGTFITLYSPEGEVIGENTYQTTDKAIRNAVLQRNQFTHSSVLMRTSLLTQVPGYRDTGLAEDLDLFLQLGTLGTFANIPKYMTAYRIHTESFNPQRTAMAKAVLGIIKMHKHTYPHYFKALLKAHLRILFTVLRSWVK